MLHKVKPLAAGMGSRALVVMGRITARAAPLFDVLAEEEINTVTYSVAGEPTVGAIRLGTQRAREADCAREPAVRAPGLFSLARPAGPC